MVERHFCSVTVRATTAAETEREKKTERANNANADNETVKRLIFTTESAIFMTFYFNIKHIFFTWNKTCMRRVDWTF